MRFFARLLTSLLFCLAFANAAQADWYASGSGTNHFDDYAGAAEDALNYTYHVPVDYYEAMSFDVWGQPSQIGACSNTGHPGTWCAYGYNTCPFLSGKRLVLWGCETLNLYLGPCDCSKNTGTQNDQLGNPVDVRSGNLFETATDFETSGQDKLTFRRYYNSNLNYMFAKGAFTSRLGVGWHTDYDATLTMRSTSEANIILPNGAPYHFTNSGSAWVADYWITSFGGEWSGTARHDTKVSFVASGTNWVFTGPDDVKYTFDSTLALTGITYRDGYTLTLAYTSGHNTSVTDSFGRQLTFTYSGDMLATMTDPDGNVYTYAYTTKPLGQTLVSVTYPDATPSPTDNPVIAYLYEDTTPINVYGLTGITDENGHRYATWSYDSKGRVLTEEFAGGANHLGFSYDDVNVKRTVTNGLGKQVTYTLGTVEGRYQSTQIDGLASTHTAASTTTFTHDANGFVTAKTDNEGNVTHYTNNSIGQETSRTEGYGTAVARTINTTWDSTYNLITQIQQPGLTTDYTYTSGKLTQLTQTDTTTTSVPYSTNGQTRTWAYTYSTAGLVHTIDGPLSGTGDTVTYTYNTDGSLASVTDQVGHTTTITSVNGRGQPLSSTDANSVVTNYTYDKLGRILTVTVDPGGIAATTTMTYDLAGEITQIQAPDDATLKYTYDNAHRLTLVTNGAGEKIAYTLNAMGGRTQIDLRTSGGTITKTQTAVFDELNRTLSAIGAASQTTAFTYDKNDNNLTVTRSAQQAVFQCVRCAEPALPADRSRQLQHWPSLQRQGQRHVGD